MMRRALLVGVLLAGACSGKMHDASTHVAPLKTFRIVYRIEQPDQPTHWSELVADRPFRVRNGTYDHEPKAGEVPQNGTLTTLDALYQLRPDGMQEISGRQPAPGTGDQYLAAQLTDAVARGLATRPGSADVLGRHCTTYRFAEPPIGPIAALAGDDHDDLCITLDGLVLQERWTFKGAQVLDRTATSIEQPKDVDAYFDVSSAQAAPDGGPVAEPTKDRSFIADPPAPKGFTRAARESFALRQPSDAGAATLYASTVWAFTDGADLVTVEAGDSSATGALPWKTTDATKDVAVKGRTAQSVVRNDGAELRFDLGNERWLRVRGTIPLDDLVDYAKKVDTGS